MSVFDFFNVFQHHTIAIYIDELNQSHNMKILNSKFVRYLKKLQNTEEAKEEDVKTQ